MTMNTNANNLTDSIGDELLFSLSLSWKPLPPPSRRSISDRALNGIGNFCNLELHIPYLLLFGKSIYEEVSTLFHGSEFPLVLTLTSIESMLAKRSVLFLLCLYLFCFSVFIFALYSSSGFIARFTLRIFLNKYILLRVVSMIVTVNISQSLSFSCASEKKTVLMTKLCSYNNFAWNYCIVCNILQVKGVVLESRIAPRDVFMK